ncbi:alcohol oxidase [Panus rudis PR-1116 ss-1]|nr:alcohol oxidase [Panus rudis PR-1116 ss-1]
MLVKVDDVMNKAFDYVVIGGGNAGLTLAARLSEDPAVSVLLLEAGAAHINDPEVLRVGFFGRLFMQKDYAYAYKITTHSGVTGAMRPWFRGKGLGGSAGINFMVWMPPPREELDDFERLGNPGWNFADWKRLTKKIEHFYPPSKERQEALQINCNEWDLGREGPLPIAYPATIPEGEHKIRESIIKAGIPPAVDAYKGNPRGVFWALNTYDPNTNTRAYPGSAFLDPIMHRPNFSVLVEARVNRILSKTGEDGTVTATGVEFDHGGETRVANVMKEVVVSAGTLESPHVLELSGIGKRDVLEKAGIPLKVELPGVGENMQDRMLIAVSWELRDDANLETWDVFRDKPEMIAKHAELHANGEGLFTVGLVNAVFAPLKTITPKAQEIYEEAKAEIQQKLDAFHPGLQEQYKYQLDRILNGAPEGEILVFPGLSVFYNPPTPGKKYLTFAVALNHPFSRGTIHSLSNDPNQDPEFDPHYFEYDVDLEIYTEVVRFVRKIADHSPLKDLVAKEHNPGPDCQTDEQVKEWVKTRCSTMWHTAGVCGMLPKEKNGVVDPQLKVYGTNNIRVADMSIVPLLFAGHPSSTVYYIAEKAAEIIKNGK